jgi:hypothetical protein
VSGAVVALALFAMEIHAVGACPDGVEIERQLAPLLGAGTAVHTADVADIVGAPDGSVSVSLADASGRSIGERTFPRARTCADQAKIVAVTLAIWEAQLHPEITLRLDRLAPADQPPLPAASDAPTTIGRSAPPPAAAAAARELSLGVAAFGDWQAGAWAPGVRVDVGLGPAPGRWRARAAVVGVGRHALDLPPGRVTWRRAFVQFGADVDVVRGSSWAVALGAGLLAGVVAMAGEGFEVDRQPRSLDLGGEVRARLEARLGRWRPWLGAGVTGGLRRQLLDLQGDTDNSAALPRLAPTLAVGADFVL